MTNPNTNKLVKDEYCFLHEDVEGVETIVKFQQVFTDKVIENFIQFLRGCGHYDVCIYTAMQFFAEEYFESNASIEALEISKENKELLKDVRKKEKKSPSELDELD